jgi:hypothetical protein
MSEHENQWAKALATNGTYAAAKAKEASEAAVSEYVSGLKRTERVLWIYLMICVAVAVFAGEHFVFATSNKAMMGCGIAFLVALETTILVKLWYWIVNTKLTLQKEIRQSRIQGTTPESAAYAPTWLGEMSLGRPGLSPWERRAWFLALVVVAVASAFLTQRYSDSIWPSNMARFDGAPVTIEAPRIGAPIFVHVYLRMDQGVCKVSRVTPENKQSEMFWMGAGSWHGGQLSGGDSLRLDPQGNKGEYWVRFE